MRMLSIGECDVRQELLIYIISFSDFLHVHEKCENKELLSLQHQPSLVSCCCKDFLCIMFLNHYNFIKQPKIIF